MVRLACAVLALLLLAAPRARAQADGADEASFRRRNDDYVRAFLTSDVKGFQALLADDFVAVLADGRLIDKAAFLRNAAVRPDAEELRLHDVAIRVFPAAAIVTASVSYHRADGTAVRTRYSTLYVLRDGAWRIVWVQWTRVSA